MEGYDNQTTTYGWSSSFVGTKPEVAKTGRYQYRPSSQAFMFIDNTYSGCVQASRSKTSLGHKTLYCLLYLVV